MNLKITNRVCECILKRPMFQKLRTNREKLCQVYHQVMRYLGHNDLITAHFRCELILWNFSRKLLRSIVSLRNIRDITKIFLLHCLNISFHPWSLSCSFEITDPSFLYGMNNFFLSPPLNGSLILIHDFCSV